jgi:hypothetical protein
MRRTGLFFYVLAPAIRIRGWKMSTSNTPDPKLKLELERMVSRKEAAARLGISTDTLDRHYRHLFVHVSPRRVGIKLKHLLATN